MMKKLKKDQRMMKMITAPRDPETLVETTAVPKPEATI
jgi:hypothetical protein